MAPVQADALIAAINGVTHAIQTSTLSLAVLAFTLVLTIAVKR